MALAFVFHSLDRCANQRADTAWLERQRERAEARVLQLSGDRVWLEGDRLVTAAGRRAPDEVFLGLDEVGAPWFARSLAEAPERGELRELRSLAISGVVSVAELGRLAHARSLLAWHERHRFCAACGAGTHPLAGGTKRKCATCGIEHFPRTDPVAIAVVRSRGRILLGRQRPWPRGMYSALAGFVEPGETFEDAARREVLEESGVRVGEVRYVASQPWPFPSSLMIGVIGEAVSEELVRDEQELEDVRWFSAEEARQMVERTHPEGLWAAHPIALAHHLVREALGLPALAGSLPGRDFASTVPTPSGDAAPTAAALRPEVPFVVMRQDDNGNRMQVARAPSRGEAEALAAEYERRGHKQLYWVEPAPAQ